MKRCNFVDTCKNTDFVYLVDRGYPELMCKRHAEIQLNFIKSKLKEDLEVAKKRIDQLHIEPLNEEYEKMMRR